MGLGDHVRIEDAEWIEHPLHGRKHLRQLREVCREEGGTRESQTLLAADRAADGDHLAVDGVRQSLQPGPLCRITRIGVGSHVQLAVGGVREEHGRRVVVLEHRLQPPEKIGHRLGRHDHVFHEWHRPHGAADPVQRGHGAAGQFPQHGLLCGILGPADVDAQRPRAQHSPRGLVEPHGGRLFVGLRKLHEQRGVGDRWDELVECRLRRAGQREVSLVEEVAGIGRERSQHDRRFRRAVQRVEEEEPHGRRLVGRHREERGLGDDSQRALGTAEEPWQVDEPIAVEPANEILKLVAAVRGAGGRLGRCDQRSR